MSFQNRILLVVALACLICTVAAITVSTRAVSWVGEEALVDKSKSILSRLESMRTYIATQGSLGSKIDATIKTYPDGKLPADAKLDILRQVPIYAALKVGAFESEKDHYTFRVFSLEPRNKDNTATESEKKVFEKFSADPELKEIIYRDSDLVTVYRPVRISEQQGCLHCHGDPANSPWKNGKDVLGYQMENWKDGNLHGIFAIISDKKELKTVVASATTNIAIRLKAASHQIYQTIAIPKTRLKPAKMIPAPVLLGI